MLLASTSVLRQSASCGKSARPRQSSYAALPAQTSIADSRMTAAAMLMPYITSHLPQGIATFILQLRSDLIGAELTSQHTQQSTWLAHDTAAEPSSSAPAQDAVFAAVRHDSADLQSSLTKADEISGSAPVHDLGVSAYVACSQQLSSCKQPSC